MEVFGGKWESRIICVLAVKATLRCSEIRKEMCNITDAVLAGVGVTAIGSAASLTWAFLGVKLQAVYKKQFRIINGILALFLLYCAWGIVRG